jgi:hypothetical protein
MDAWRIQLKLYLDAPERLALHDFVPVFHDWIRRHALEERLIDVADYAHVHHGPGVLLEGHGSDYFIDVGEGRLGLLYSKKRDAPPPAERLADVFRRTLAACRLLESEPSLSPRVRFRTDELLLRVMDRLRAPNSDATLAAVEPELRALFGRLFGTADVTLAREGDAREPFSLRVRIAGAPALAELCARL